MLDYHRFLHKSENQRSIYELLNGVAEMKLNQFESYKISEWGHEARLLILCQAA